MLRRTALAALTDVERVTPELRNVAANCWAANVGGDARPGVGLRADGLPDIDWVEIPAVDEQEQQEFIYQEDERRTEPTFWIARYPDHLSSVSGFHRRRRVCGGCALVGGAERASGAAASGI